VIAVLACTALALGSVVQAGPPPDWEEARQTWEDVGRLPPGYDMTGAGVYLAYDDPAYGIDPPGAPIVGGMKDISWSLLEPNEDDYRFTTEIGDWVTGMAAHGKKAGIIVEVYKGREGGGVRVPEWLWLKDADVRLYNPYDETGGLVAEGFWVLNYLNSTYQQEYANFVEAFAQYLDDNPTVADNVAWVMVSTGLDNETQPSANRGLNRRDLYYYKDVLNWTSEQWVAYVNGVTDFYHASFTAHGLPNVLYLNMAPGFKNSSWERVEWSDHAAALGVGLRNSGLRVDWSNWPAYQPLKDHFDETPIGWEFYVIWTYMPPYGDTEAQGQSNLYWTVLNGLAKHPDSFTWVDNSEKSVVTNPVFRSSFELANEYCGVTLSTTPSVWCVLRKNWSVKAGDPYNYEFWLWQDESPADGKTAPKTNVDEYYDTYSGTTLYPAEYDVTIDPDPGNRAMEGRYCRSTRQEYGSPYMYFDIGNDYEVGATEATFKVTYFDYGYDQWQLEYDALSESYKALGPVTKTGSNQWKTQVWTVYDASLNGDQTSDTDFRINCLGDGNEYIHIVHVTKGSGGAQTHDIPLSAGANLVSLPLQPGDSSVAGVFAGIWANFSKVYAYEAATTTWTKYDKNGPPYGNSLTNVDETMGLWVYVDGACTLQASGVEPSSTQFQLHSGANLVSWPSMDTVPVGTAFAGIWDQFSKVYAYDAATTTWTKYDKNGPPYGNSLQNVEPGMGLWVYVDTNCTWTVTN